jgi:peptide/nickel transport system substrate-binding protein
MKLKYFYKVFLSIFTIVVFFALGACSRDEMSLEEYNASATEGLAALLAKTVSKPYAGEDFVPGRLGGTWYSAITSDPKSFNHLIAEYDSATSAILSGTTDYLIDYNPLTREWEPQIASAEIKVYEDKGKLYKP